MSRISTEGSMTKNILRKISRRSKVLAAAVAGLGLFGARANAAGPTTYNWINPAGGNWSDAANWQGGLVMTQNPNGNDRNLNPIGVFPVMNAASTVTYNLGDNFPGIFGLVSNGGDWTLVGSANNKYLDFSETDRNAYARDGITAPSAGGNSYIQVNAGTMNINMGLDANDRGEGLIKYGAGTVVFNYMGTNALPNTIRSRTSATFDPYQQSSITIEEGTLAFSDVRAIWRGGNNTNDAIIGIGSGGTLEYRGTGLGVMGTLPTSGNPSPGELSVGGEVIFDRNLGGALPRVNVTSATGVLVAGGRVRGGQGADFQLPFGRDAFVKTGPGEFRAGSAQNNIDGNLYIENGTFAVQAISSLGTPWNLADLNNNELFVNLTLGSDTTRGLLKVYGTDANQRLDAPIILRPGGGGLNVGLQGVTLTYNKRITGGPNDTNRDGNADVVGYANAVAFEKAGSGNLVFGGTPNTNDANVGNNFFGDILISGGTLETPGDKALGSTFNRVTMDTKSGELTATFRHSGTGTYDPDVRRRFEIGAGGGAIDLPNGRTMVLDGGPTETPAPAGIQIHQQFFGSGTFTKTGRGTLVLGRFNPSQPDQNSDGYAPIAGDVNNPGFTGRMNINQGSVQLNHHLGAGAKVANPNPANAADFNEIHLTGRGRLVSNTPLPIANPVFIDGTLARDAATGELGGGLASAGPERTFGGPVTVTATSTLSATTPIRIEGLFKHVAPGQTLTIDGPAENISSAINFTNLANQVTNPITVTAGGGVGVAISGTQTALGSVNLTTGQLDRVTLVPSATGGAASITYLTDDPAAVLPLPQIGAGATGTIGLGVDRLSTGTGLKFNLGLQGLMDKYTGITQFNVNNGNGYAWTNQALNLNRNIAIGGGVEGRLEQEGVVSGAGTLTKRGPSTLHLANATNTWTGGLNLQDGRVTVGGAGSLGGASNPLNISGGVLDIGTVQLTAGTTTMTGGEIAGLPGGKFSTATGKLTRAAGGSPAVLSAPLNLPNGIIVDGGPLTITNSSTDSPNAIGAAGVTVQNNGTLVLPFVPANAAAKIGAAPVPATANLTLAGGNLVIDGSTGLSTRPGLIADYLANPDLAAQQTAMNTFQGMMDFFNARTPAVRTITNSTNLDFSGDPLFRIDGFNNFDNISARFLGKINITTAGVYTFFTNSDDGSMMYINGQVVVNNNFNQGNTSRSGTINLGAGAHDIALAFYEGGGGNQLGAGIRAAFAPWSSGATTQIPVRLLNQNFLTVDAAVTDMGNTLRVGHGAASAAANKNSLTLTNTLGLALPNIEMGGPSPELNITGVGAPVTVTNSFNIGATTTGTVTLNPTRLNVPSITGLDLPIVKNGAGVFQIEGASTGRTALMTVNEGQVIANNALSLGAKTNVQVQPFAQLTINAANINLTDLKTAANSQVIINGVQDGAAATNPAVAPTAAQKGNIEVQSASGINSGATQYTLRFDPSEADPRLLFNRLTGGDGTTFNVNVEVLTGGSLYIGGNAGRINIGNSTNGTISGAGGLIHSGNAAWYQGRLTYTGDTVIEAGAMQLRGDNAGTDPVNRVGDLLGTTYTGGTAKILLLQGGELHADNGGYNNRDRIPDGVLVDARGGRLGIWGNRNYGTTATGNNTNGDASHSHERINTVDLSGRVEFFANGGTGNGSSTTNPNISELLINTLKRRHGGQANFTVTGNIANSTDDQRHRIVINNVEHYDQFGLVSIDNWAGGGFDDKFIGGQYTVNNDDFATIKNVNDSTKLVRQIGRFSPNGAGGGFVDDSAVNLWTAGQHAKFQMAAADPNVVINSDRRIESLNWDNVKAGGTMEIGSAVPVTLTVGSGGMLLRGNQDLTISNTGNEFPQGRITSGTSELHAHTHRQTFLDAVVTDNATFDSVTLVKSGGATLQLRHPSNSFTGGVYVNQATLLADPVFAPLGSRTGNVLGTGRITLNGGNLEVRDNNSILIGQGNGSPVDIRSNATILVRNSNANDGNRITFGNLKIFNGRTLTVNQGNNYTAAFNDVTLEGGRTTFNVNTGVFINGAVNAPASTTLIKNGGGTLQLQADSQLWQGKLVINNGVVSVRSARALPGNVAAPTGITVNSGLGAVGILAVDIPGNPVNYNVRDGVTFNPGSGFRLSVPQTNSAFAPNEPLGIFEINHFEIGSNYDGVPIARDGVIRTLGGSVRTVNGQAVGSYDSTLNLAGPTQFDITTGTFSFTEPITGGSVGVTKAGGGTMVVSGANSYAGGTTVLNGTLRVDNADGLGGGTVTVGGGTLDLVAAAARKYAVNLAGGRVNFNVNGDVATQKVSIRENGLGVVASGNRVAPGAASSEGGSVGVGQVDMANNATLDLVAGGGVPLNVNLVRMAGAGTISNSSNSTLISVRNIQAGTNTVKFTGQNQTTVSGNVQAGKIILGAPVNFAPGSTGTSTALGADEVTYGGALTAQNGTVDFGTRRLVAEVPGVRIGLLEGSVAGSFSQTGANPGQFGINQAGPIRTQRTDGWTNDTTYIYTGQVHVPETGPSMGQIAFAKHFDDNMLIRIDGQQVMNHTAWNVTQPTGKLVLTPGWHDIEIRAGQGGGGAGPSGQASNGFTWPGGNASFDAAALGGHGKWVGGKGLGVDRGGNYIPAEGKWTRQVLDGVNQFDPNAYETALNRPNATASDPDLLFRTFGGLPLGVSAGATFKAGGVHNILDVNLAGDAAASANLVLAEFPAATPAVNEVARLNTTGLASITVGANNTQRTSLLTVGNGGKLTIAGNGGTLAVGKSTVVNIQNVVTEPRIVLPANATIEVTGSKLLVNTVSVDKFGARTDLGRIIATGAGTVGGTGTVSRLEAVAGGHISPGNNGAGTFTVDSLTLGGATLDWDLAATQAASDLLVVSNANTSAAPDGLTISGTNTFAFTNSATNKLTAGTQIKVLDYTGDVLTAAELASFAVPSGYRLTHDAAQTALFVEVLPSENRWIGTTALSSLASNWAAGVPAVAGAEAIFDNSGLTKNVSVDADIVAGKIEFREAQAYSLAAAGGNVRLSSSTAAPATLTVAAGDHSIAAPVFADSDSNVSVATGSKLTLSAAVTVANGKSLVKSGAGALATGNVTTGTGSNLQVNEGTMTAGNVDGTGATSVATGAKLTAGRIRQSSLSIGGTAASKSTVAITPSAPIPNGQDAQVSVVNALSIANDGAPIAGGTRQYFGQLDLGNNDLVVRASAANIATTLAEVEDMIRSGLYSDPNGTFWAGNGIASSVAAADAELRLGIGMIRNENPFSPGEVIYDTFDGVSGLTINDILVKVTYFGDNDLSGTVDATDIGLLGVGLDGSLPASWISGDYDYSNVVDGGDIGLIGVGLGNAFGQVPEPGMLSIAAVGALGLMGRRRRRSASKSA